MVQSIVVQSLSLYLLNAVRALEIHPLRLSPECRFPAVLRLFRDRWVEHGSAQFASRRKLDLVQKPQDKDQGEVNERGEEELTGSLGTQPRVTVSLRSSNGPRDTQKAQAK